MANELYVIAAILFIAWVIGFIVYHAGLVHILLVFAIIAVLLKIIARA